MSRWLRAHLLAFLTAIWCSDPGLGQELRGRVLVEDAPGQTVAGALVTLLAQTGSAVDASLTRADGSFGLNATGPGEYRVRIERIGFETWTSGLISLASSQARSMEFAVPIKAVRLAALDITLRRQCVDDPRETDLLFAVWDEVRKALQAALVAEREQLLRFNSITFSRRASRRNLEVTEVATKAAYGTLTTPFESRPANELSQRGYVQEEGETAYFYAPDAKVLLSDKFMEDHCFGAQRRERDGRRLVGLTFEPVDHREAADIKGVLWVDETSAELSHVEFVYTGIPFRGVDDDRIGGRIDFSRLATGAFVVSDWLIRVPILEQSDRDRRRDRYDVAGFLEHGGQLRDVLTPLGEPLDWARGASIRGTVADPVTGEPLRDANVWLDRPQGADVLRHTGPQGTFLFDELTAGKQTLRLTHPTLELVGIESVEQEIEVADGETVSVMLDLPTAEEITRRLCPEHDGTAVVVGRVSYAENGFPRGAIPVWAGWRARTDEEPPGTAGSGDLEKTTEVRTDRLGRYVLCGLPRGEVVHVFAGGAPDTRAQTVEMSRPIVVMNFEVS